MRRFPWLAAQPRGTSPALIPGRSDAAYPRCYPTPGKRKLLLVRLFVGGVLDQFRCLFSRCHSAVAALVHGPWVPTLGRLVVVVFVGHTIVLIISWSRSWSRRKDRDPAPSQSNALRTSRNPHRFCLHFSAFGQVSANSSSTMRGRFQCAQ